jgi:flagellar biosynthesis protein FliQ
VGPDLAVEIVRHLLMEALFLAAPVLILSAAVSLVLSLVQTLTGIQEQTLTAVPRLLTVAAVLVISMPWFLHRLTAYTIGLWTDFHKFLG